MQSMARKLAAGVVFAGAVTISALAQAGWVQGTVSRICAGPELGDKVAFKIFPAYPQWPREGRPACSIYDEWAVDTSTPAGERLYSVLLAASQQNLRLQVYGSGTCSVTGDREDVRFLYFCKESITCAE